MDFRQRPKRARREAIKVDQNQIELRLCVEVLQLGSLDNTRMKPALNDVPKAGPIDTMFVY
jgi:hypothetical protein